ncbi:hypothetical protein ACVDG3_06915 [Meridianimarinicoccus sp. RP-17]|uniref:hypothetical protein n=1 Tax=Meridianimarinicoccus zhengii TaxID=2056810 RepID=UPI0013A6B55B|nr:hypothetical protein [Phycocomes zhengii]
MRSKHDRCEPGTIWRHRQTGHVYVVVGPCQIEATWRPGVLYRRINNADEIQPVGPIVRDREEFLDGRFEPLNIVE